MSTAEPETKDQAPADDAAEQGDADAAQAAADLAALPTSLTALPPVANPLIPRLQDLCLDVITKNFEQCTQIHLLAPKYRLRVLQQLSLTLDLSLAVMTVPDGLYWKRRTLATFPNLPHDPTRKTWKRFFLENYASKKLEDATEATVDEVFNELKIVGPFIRQIKLNRSPYKVSMFRLFRTFRSLKSLSLVYGEPRRSFAQYEEFDNFDVRAENSATLRDCQILCQDFIALGQYCSLQEFDMSDNSLTDQSFLRVAKGLFTALNGLTSLTFSHNEIGDEGAKAIASCLLNSPIRKLDLSDNKIGPDGCERIVACALKCPTFAELNLASNRIGDLGCEAIAELLEKCKTLTYLNIAGNRIEHMSALARALETNLTIQNLILSANPISEADLVELTRIGDHEPNDDEPERALGQLDLRIYELTPDDFNVSTTETSEAPLLRFK